jgi:hypothetical protein
VAFEVYSGQENEKTRSEKFQLYRSQRLFFAPMAVLANIKDLENLKGAKATVEKLIFPLPEEFSNEKSKEIDESTVVHSFPTGAVLAHVSVEYSATDTYSIGQNGQTNKLTSTGHHIWKFTGCISDHEELNWRVTKIS